MAIRENSSLIQERKMTDQQTKHTQDHSLLNMLDNIVRDDIDNQNEQTQIPGQETFIRNLDTQSAQDLLTMQLGHQIHNSTVDLPQTFDQRQQDIYS